MKCFIEGTHMRTQLFMQLHAHAHRHSQRNMHLGKATHSWSFWEHTGNGRMLSSWSVKTYYNCLLQRSPV